MPISVSIVIMTYNETDLLRKTLNTVLCTCNHDDLCEIIIVTAPKSTPENLETAEALMGCGGDVPVSVYMQKKPYIGNACREAIEIAQGTHIIIMPADGEIEIEAAARMIELSKEHPDTVITTSRWLNSGSFSGYNKLKLALNFLFNRMMGLMFRTELTDVSNVYQIAPLSTLRALHLTEEKEAFYLECELKLIRAGSKIIEIPCKWSLRDDGKAKAEILKCFSYIGTALRIRFSKHSYIVRGDNDEKKRLFCSGKFRNL